MYIATINENRGDEFEREQEGVCGKFVGRDMKEKQCNYIIIS